MDLLRYRDELIITRISNGHKGEHFKRSVNGNVTDHLDWSLDILPVLPKSNSGKSDIKVEGASQGLQTSLQESHISSVEDDYSGSICDDEIPADPTFDDEDSKSLVEESEYTTDMLPAAFCEATVSREDAEKNQSELPDSTGSGLALAMFGLKEQKLKKFRCGECNYSTDVSSHFRAHKRRHTGERPYACTECPYRAAESCTLNRHKLTHTGAKKHMCPLCPYKAFLAGDVAKHMRCHTGERPYSCPLCPYRASRRSSVKEHLATHSSDKEYPCDMCGHLCATRIQLRRHMKNKHFISPLSGTTPLLQSSHLDPALL